MKLQRDKIFVNENLAHQIIRNLSQLYNFLSQILKMMLQLVLVVVTLCNVAAFVPTGAVRNVRSLAMSSTEKVDAMVGASIEVNGGEIYDPLGMLKLHDIAPGVLPHPKWLREAELKHSRIAMLAVVGAFTGQLHLTIPGYTSNIDPVQNLNAFVLDWPLGFTQIIASIGIIEGANFPGEFWFGKGDREAGDMGFDPLGFFNKKNQAQKDYLRLNELKNGRLAMIALAGFYCEAKIPGSVPFGGLF